MDSPSDLLNRMRRCNWLTNPSCIRDYIQFTIKISMCHPEYYDIIHLTTRCTPDDERITVNANVGVLAERLQQQHRLH
jgi:hypothetical protein